MTSISLETAIAIGESSKRTWWRRISSNPALRKGTDSRGRTMIALEGACDFISIPDEQDASEIIIFADAGDVEAQNYAGLMFSDADNPKAAVYWWVAAAEQGHADAMHFLGVSYIKGLGVIADENLGIMWIARAASCGHIIAQIQMKGLRPFGDCRALHLPSEQ